MYFPEMLERPPTLGARLIGVVADRVRTPDQQRERLTAPGKLSAGIAHELNNPAAAVRNAAINFQQVVRALRTAGIHLDQCEISARRPDVPGQD
jgi:signal transduction histidine kinase